MKTQGENAVCTPRSKAQKEPSLLTTVVSTSSLQKHVCCLGPCLVLGCTLPPDVHERGAAPTGGGGGCVWASVTSPCCQTFTLFPPLL